MLTPVSYAQVLNPSRSMSSSSPIFLPNISPVEFELYLAGLRRLVNHPSPFTEPAAVSSLMGEVHARMACLLPNYRHQIDGVGNLICIPNDHVPTAPTLYLSAHVDTVPANPSIWTAPFAPHPAYEDEHEIVAQGVNDCKAGVATELWLAELAACGALDLHNVVFTFTFKEEGGGLKTGTALGEAFGSNIPEPSPGSTLLVLENTIRSDPPYLPLVYAAENSSYTIHISGPLVFLRAAQLALADWRPVAISPVHPPSFGLVWTDHAPQGHVCTAPPNKNPLLAALLAADRFTLLCAGDERSHGTVPSSIGHARGTSPDALHRLTLTKRGHFPLAATLGELAPFDHTPAKPLAQSVGFDVSHRCASSPVGAAFLAAGNAGAVAFDRNPGASDATMITSVLAPAYRENLLPLVCGPGTRSQRNAAPPRLTHGPNETFIKPAGRRALATLLALLTRAGHATPVPGIHCNCDTSPCSAESSASPILVR
jgi:hypothetical protein